MTTSDHTSPIDILLATRNGAPHLPEQLDSLLSQTDDHWRLLVRDDASTDETPGILERYRDRHPDRIVLVDDDGRRLGACGNFGLLLERSSAPLVMFCDQDDLWIPEKVELTRQEMRRLEALHGPSTPLLVHTDLAVVSEDGRPIAPSLWRYQGSFPPHRTLNRLLIQNCVTGCTVMINRPLKNLSLPIPPEAVMHDWWIALTAAAFGVIGEIHRPTVMYRQHGANDTGARRWGVADVARRIVDRRRAREEFARTVTQGESFFRRHRERLSPRQNALLHAYASLSTAGGVKRRIEILRHRFFYAGIVRNLGRLLIG